MKQEDIRQALEALGKGGINVAGDLVMNKRVEYEVNNVEAGGIGIQIVNGKEDRVRVTDEQVSRAISAINGKDKVLKHQQAFLGICCYLASCHQWPNKKETAVKRINQLPDADQWEIACKWESIRKFVACKFAMTDYSEWDEYNARELEREIFLECRDVARAFDEQLKAEMKK